MTTRSFIALFLLVLSVNAAGQKEGLESINRNDLKASMTFFASDNLKGRETGSPENDIAALYLKTSLMQLGLKPIAETGDYLQAVPLISSEIKGKETFISAKDKDGKELFSTDSILYLMAPFSSLEAASKLVFAGYGISDSAAGYDDFKGIDATDKVLLVMTGSPGETAPEKVNAVFNMDVEKSKLMAAFKRKVRAVIYVYDPRSKFTDAYSSGLADMGLSRVGSKFMMLKAPENAPTLQIGFITRYAADQLLKKSGHSLKELQEKITVEKKPASFESPDIDITFKTYIEQSSIMVSNVIGMIEGSDPELRKECVIYTAHYDHVGVNKKGEAFNGADDNASGSMALLEVAGAFMKLKKKPARTILFAWVNGEEKGLLGSESYTMNPVIPLENTLMDINLDMVGRSKTQADSSKFMGFDPDVSQSGEIYMYTDQKGKDILDLINSSAKKAGIVVTNKGTDHPFGSSDHASFRAKDVPSMFFNSGVYADLHSINDDVEKIDFDKMERVSKMVFLIGYDIANQKKRFIPDTIKTTPRGE